MPAALTAAAIEKLPYRAGVGMMLLNQKGQVFIARRIDTTSEAWQMPQGGIDKDEAPRSAALRELEEEIGTGKAEIIAESKDWYHYDLPAHLVPVIWKGRFRGQRQKWFVLRYMGADADINIDTKHPEFAEWQWADPKTLPDVIVPFKKELYARLLVEFRELVGNR